MKVQHTSEVRVDPRIERSRQVIRHAALSEFATTGYGGFTIEAVAARAGVGRNTVYRHWDGKLSLIADALETLNEQPAPQFGDGTGRERVEMIMRHLAGVLAGSPFSACIPALVEAADRDPTVREFHLRYSARRRRRLAAMIQVGVDNGEFPPTLDVELASLALAGALFYSRLMGGEPLDPGAVPDLVRTVLGPGEPDRDGR